MSSTSPVAAAEPPAETRSRLADVIHHRPLASFFVLAFGISWLLWTPLVVSGEDSPTGLLFVLLLLGSLVPSSVAVALVAVLHGKHGVRLLFRRLLLWKVSVGWWAVVVLLPLFVVGAVGLNILLGADTPDVTITIPGAVALFLFSIFPGSSGGEELGWRGFALPHMQAGWSALKASLVLGVAWGVWHFPLYLLGADIRPLSVFPAWVLLTVALSVILTWMYNGTGGSLLLVVLLHASSNLPLTIFFEEDIVRPFLIYVALMLVAAAVVVAATGPATLSRTRPKQTAVP